MQLDDFLLICPPEISLSEECLTLFEEVFMKKDKRNLFLDTGVLFSVALCFFSAFLVIYQSSRDSVQTVENQPSTINTPVQSPAVSMSDSVNKKMLMEALKKKPDHVPVLLQLAHLEAESGNALKASIYLTEALQYEPRNLEAKLNLGKQMFEMGNIDDAIRLNQEILEIEPVHPDALYNLGAIYGNLGNRERALFFWNQLINSNTNSESGVQAIDMMARM